MGYKAVMNQYFVTLAIDTFLSMIQDGIAIIWIYINNASSTVPRSNQNRYLLNQLWLPENMIKDHFNIVMHDSVL